MKTKQIKIKYIRDIEPLLLIDKGNWIDLRAGKEMFIPEGTTAMIPLGVAMQLPEKCEAIIAPRSSMFKKYGLIQTNSIGIIDSSYCGGRDEWKLPVFCLKGNTDRNGKKGTLVKKNDRICQFRLLKNQPTIEFEIVEILGNENRGGFGSTGEQ